MLYRHPFKDIPLWRRIEVLLKASSKDCLKIEIHVHEPVYTRVHGHVYTRVHEHVCTRVSPIVCTPVYTCIHTHANARDYNIVYKHIL